MGPRLSKHQINAIRQMKQYVSTSSMEIEKPVWTKPQLDVMRALLRIYHRSQVPGILYAACKHIGHEPENSHG